MAALFDVSVDQILVARRAALGAGGGRWQGLLPSVVIHVVLAGTLVVSPLIQLRKREPIEFIPVQLVPAQALGVTRPAPAKPQPATPAPEPKVEKTRPEPETPSLPEPEKAKKPQEKPRAAEPPAPQPSDPSTRSSERAERVGSPQGNSLGTVAFGATVGGLDNPDFVYGYYIDQMLALISTNWLRPSLGGGVEAVVHFRILRKGEITELRIAQSSGYNSFDLAGLRAVQLAAPFPPLPQSYPGGSLGVNLILR